MNANLDIDLEKELGEEVVGMLYVGMEKEEYKELKNKLMGKQVRLLAKNKRYENELDSGAECNKITKLKRGHSTVFLIKLGGNEYVLEGCKVQQNENGYTLVSSIHTRCYKRGGYEEYLKELGKRLRKYNEGKDEGYELMAELYKVLLNTSKFYRHNLLRSAEMSLDDIVKLLKKNGLDVLKNSTWSFTKHNMKLGKFDYTTGLTCDELKRGKAGIKAINYFKKKELDGKYVTLVRDLLKEKNIRQDEIDLHVPYGVIRNKSYEMFMEKCYIAKEEAKLYNKYRINNK